MPKRPFEAEVIRIYEPDMTRMVKALRTIIEYQPSKEESASHTDPSAKEGLETTKISDGLPPTRAAGQ